MVEREGVDGGLVLGEGLDEEGILSKVLVSVVSGGEGETFELVSALGLTPTEKRVFPFLNILAVSSAKR